MPPPTLGTDGAGAGRPTWKAAAPGGLAELPGGEALGAIEALGASEAFGASEALGAAGGTTDGIAVGLLAGVGVDGAVATGVNATRPPSTSAAVAIPAARPATIDRRALIRAGAYQ